MESSCHSNQPKEMLKNFLLFLVLFFLFWLSSWLLFLSYFLDKALFWGSHRSVKILSRNESSFKFFCEKRSMSAIVTRINIFSSISLFKFPLSFIHSHKNGLGWWDFTETGRKILFTRLVNDKSDNLGI